MKKSKILLAIVSGLFIVSCSKDDDTITQTITEEEAVEIAEASLAKQSAGLTETTYEYTKSYEQEISLNLQCNQQATDSYNVTFNNSIIQAAYNYNWNYTVTCNGLNIPQSATFNSSGNGTYTTSRIASNDTSTLTATVTGLQPTSTTMNFNATFEREGTKQLTTNQTTRTANTDFNATLVDLIVGKSDYRIDSGNGMFSLTGSTNQGNFSYEGTIIFNGDNTAIITLNGNQYTINLN